MQEDIFTYSHTHRKVSMAAIVLYPVMGMGHLISMVELSKLILTHHPLFTVNILLPTAPYATGSTAQYISAVSTTNPSIIFHHLPPVSLPQDPASYPCVEALLFDLTRLNNPNVHTAIQSISQTSTVHALILDFFCAAALHVAAELYVPAYFFFTSSASGLALFFHFPTIDRSTNKNFKDLETTVNLPCLPPIPLSHMPEPILEKDTAEYAGFIDCSVGLSKSTGIIVNTFNSLEPKAVKDLADGVCYPDGPTPPVFCIGPLIATNHQIGNESDDKVLESECLTWLDKQPSQSVVFLCFGSLGLLSKAQLREIAIGLERSGQRFLWVVRNPPPEDKRQRFLTQPDPDLNSLLPDGFLDRTKERGLVVKRWAPQVAVLNHEAVGGFVTHCGWNSVLESICAGVPMVAWPLYAEQKLNKALLVEELKLALAMNESKTGFVSATEVEKRVKELMESEEGNSLRERVTAKRNEAMKAMGKGGSSRVALAKLVEQWK
ncbi:putative UDP-glucosyl transferase 88A1 [Tripterygium wilfordii]|uniref:Glycosyltransferase n=1 Tax=Tripterygium wilfordii TaxID=458696 RepID=A0A7J7CAS0_TRIWF|nr:UDP-glycosyltransferase 88B1-like [Tripterygium wilfordii]KAF5731202.1 putative UDP-glucosyl transferase 88A1 [Tripterygium wilfordii]